MRAFLLVVLLLKARYGKGKAREIRFQCLFRCLQLSSKADLLFSFSRAQKIMTSAKSDEELLQRVMRSGKQVENRTCKERRDLHRHSTFL